MIDQALGFATPAGLRLRALGVLAAAGALAVALVLPYQFALTPLPAKLPLPVPLLLLVAVLQSTVLLTVCAAVGLWLGPRVGLGFPGLERRLAGQRQASAGQWLPVILAGAVTGVVIIAVLLVLPLPQTTTTNPAWWKGLLASFYGGFGEEVLLRLGVMTLLAWLLSRVWQRDGRPATGVYWVSLIAAALLFGAGHLPLAATVYGLTPRIVFTIVAANSVGGLVFGWLYWRRGLGAAMVAHFTADLVLHVATPIVMGLMVHR